MKPLEDYLKELFEEPLNLEEGSIEYDFLKVLKKAQLEFAIDVLEEIFTNGCEDIDDNCSKDDLVKEYIVKIQELKTYLDEEG